MEHTTPPIHELGAREAPRYSKKSLARIAASLLMVSSSLFLPQSESPDHTPITVETATDFQFHHAAIERRLNWRHRPPAPTVIPLKLISNIIHSPNFGLWMSGLQAQSQTSIPQSQPNHSYVTVTMNDQTFLACTRGHESDTSGGYQAISSDGVYYGAYQFKLTTWNNTAIHAGRLDLVGINPAQASPTDQDLLATDLYHWQGNAPWGGRC